MHALISCRHIKACTAQIAVLKETDGRGPYSSLIMAVVIVKDVLVFACFAVNIETSRVVRRTHLVGRVRSLGSGGKEDGGPMAAPCI